MHALTKSLAVAAVAASTTVLASCTTTPRVARAEAPPPAPPAPPAAARAIGGRAGNTPALSPSSIEVEISDTPAGSAAKTAFYSLAVVDDSGWSRLESRTVAGRLSLQARSDRVRGGPAIVRVDVQRNEFNGPDLVVSQSVLFSSGRRTVLGRLARGDGGSTEIAMTTR